jgi:hypothetical protein
LKVGDRNRRNNLDYFKEEMPGNYQNSPVVLLSQLTTFIWSVFINKLQ